MRRLLRDSLSFQLKLALDWLRDVALSPIALVLALVGMLVRPQHPGVFFYRLMDAGRRSDAWINLFAASGREADSQGVDEVLDTLEARLVQRFQKEEVSYASRAGAVAAIQRVRDLLRRERRGAGEEDSD